MYQKPSVSRFGTFRELTQAGCTGTSDLSSRPLQHLTKHEDRALLGR